MYRTNRLTMAPDGSGGAGGGGGAPAWYGNEANKSMVEAKGFKSVDDVFAWGTNAEKLIGLEKAGRTVVMPKDDNDAEGIKSFRQKLGVPDKIDGYATPDALKEDPIWGHATAAAMKHGIPAKAFDAFIADVLGAAKSHNEKLDADLKAAHDKQAADVKAKHGDKFDAKVELGRRAAKGFGFDDAKLDAWAKAIGSTDMLEFFIALGDKMGEPKAAGGGNEGGGAGLTQEQAAAKLKQLNADRVAGKVSDAEFQRESQKLGPLAYPEQKVA